MYRRYLKRVIDILLSFILLILIFPILLITSIIIKLDTTGPIFFIQKRVGYKGNYFYIFKFRTMIHSKRATMDEIQLDNPEITRVGRYLRRFKLDELPQVINVLKGDMSIVGPRPTIPEQLENFNEDAMFRLKVRPGITGLAQVNGNIYINWSERWKYDKKYVENLSFLLDVKIIYKTFFIILLGEERKFSNNV